MSTIPPTSRTRLGRSRIRAVPTVLPPPSDAPAGQLALIFGDSSSDPAERSDTRVRVEVVPGAVHVPGFLDRETQRALAAAFRLWALPPAGLRHPRVPTGHLMGVQSVCLGWHWQPYAYSRTADDTDGAPVKPLPADLIELGRAAVAAAYGPASGDAYRPDAAIVNLYAPGTHLGLHCDGEEPAEAPVVTLSLGDDCIFRFAGVGRRTAPFVDVHLRSGDLLVFGGPSRRIYHGVAKLLDGSAPPGLGLPPGRLSITLRETGLDD
jgi:alkylated DNA repair protein (DNA oxidative demethylase)